MSGWSKMRNNHARWRAVFSFLCLIPPLLHSASYDIHDPYYSPDTYYIDNNQVLLYKITNWWNMSRPEESHRLCNRPVKCVHHGAVSFEYIQKTRMLELHFKEGFANLLSAIKQCKQCYGPSYLKNQWLNQTYFGKAKAETIQNETTTITTLSFSDMKNSSVEKLKNIHQNIALILEGKIGGMLRESGQIALYPEGDFFRNCPHESTGDQEHFLITLQLVNIQTKETIAKYVAVWDQK